MKTLKMTVNAAEKWLRNHYTQAALNTYRALYAESDRSASVTDLGSLGSQHNEILTRQRWALPASTRARQPWRRIPLPIGAFCK
jgi:hypothetical protein